MLEMQAVSLSRRSRRGLDNTKVEVLAKKNIYSSQNLSVHLNVFIEVSNFDAGLKCT